MKPFRRILFATDFSSASRRAFTTAVRVAKGSRAPLVVVHVAAPLMRLAPEQYIASTTWDAIEEGAQTWARRQLSRLVERATKQGVRPTGLLLQGMASQEIVRAARSKRCDLIVLGTHGRTGLSKLVLGSVAGRVVATAPCSVLTVRGR